MRMKSKISISLILLFFSLISFGQVNDESIRQEVLKNNVIDSLNIFGKWDKIGGTETHLKYLGIIKTKKGNYKIMTSCWLWGQSKRATNRILIFSIDNKYLGNYYLTSRNDLPEKIEKNQLVFLHSKNDDCDKNTITKLSFEKGIPAQFFLECKDGSGDIYSYNRK